MKTKLIKEEEIKLVLELLEESVIESNNKKKLNEARIDYYNEFIAQLKQTGLSGEFASKIAEAIFDNVSEVGDNFFNKEANRDEIRIGRLQKIKKSNTSNFNKKQNLISE